MTNSSAPICHCEVEILRFLACRNASKESFASSECALQEKNWPKPLRQISILELCYTTLNSSCSIFDIRFDSICSAYFPAPIKSDSHTRHAGMDNKHKSKVFKMCRCRRCPGGPIHNDRPSGRSLWIVSSNLKWVWSLKQAKISGFSASGVSRMGVAFNRSGKHDELRRPDLAPAF